MRFVLMLLLLLASSASFALDLPLRFQTREQFNSIQNFEDPEAKLHVTVSQSELLYDDLSPAGLKEIEGLFEVKKEYGKMFGFNKWTPGRRKIIEEPRGRFLVLEGQYLSAQGKPVYFLEIYWADKSKAQEFLVTSDDRSIPIEEYSKVFTP